MQETQKQIILQNANVLQVSNLIPIIEKGDITLEEFKLAGLSADKISEIENTINLEVAKERAAKELERKEEELRLAKERAADERNEFLKKVVRKRVSVDEIRNKINSGLITFDDLEDEGISPRTINSFKYSFSTERIPIFKKVEDLPPMEEGRTDVYFVGLAGTGKSTMLSGMLNMANKDGILLPDTYAQDGAVYQVKLISDLNRGVLPVATASGSFNYIALSLNDENNQKHPFNIVEVPGELYKDMFNNADVGALLKYIKNSNKKILIFVVDSLAHETIYEDATNGLDQSLVYVNILNMFKKSGVLENTDAIYLVANKFDAIKESRYADDSRPDNQLAYEFLNEEFKNLINNCLNIREESKNKFKIKVLPYSIGHVTYGSIVESFNREYSKEILNNLIEDSFIVKRTRWNVFK